MKQKHKMDKGKHLWQVKGQCAAIQWKDAKHLNIFTTSKDPRQLREVKRTMKDGKKSKAICPNAIIEYLKYMCGVDYFDQLREQYFISRRARKWWLRLFYFLVDAALWTHTWFKYSHARKTMKLLQHICFLLQLSWELMSSFSSRERKGGSVTAFAYKEGPLWRQWASPMRFHGCWASPSRTTVNIHKMPLLFYKTHGKRSQYGCSTCKVPFCMASCFMMFHQKWVCLGAQLEINKCWLLILEQYCSCLDVGSTAGRIFPRQLVLLA